VKTGVRNSTTMSDTDQSVDGDGNEKKGKDAVAE